ncbi:MAG TPA: biopolymer transporter ExbD [Paludibacteraceae bacterium]|nr:biopolymer transporter ExbD [Paludibacteraceae bacterium]HPT43652.1 biopolymer transporter ExbD [Paludibacteraceae bacterium]
MSLKRKYRTDPSFSMSSMTDIIFLLLLFFVISSTMTTPNDIKLNLPSSKSEKATKKVIAKVSIDREGNYFVSRNNEKSVPVTPESLEPYILNLVAQDTTTYLALYADEEISYKQVVRVLDIANQNKLKLVIATKAVANTEE